MGLISIAQAATTAANNTATPPNNSLFSSGLMILAFVFIFYFLIWRPQSRRMKDQKQLLSSVAVGDEVTTNGGIVGKITKLDDNVVHLNIAEGVTIKLRKEAIANILPKGSLKAQPEMVTSNGNVKNGKAKNDKSEG